MPVVQIARVVDARLIAVNQKGDALIGRAIGIDGQKDLLPEFPPRLILHEAANFRLGLGRQETHALLNLKRQRGAAYVVR